MNIIQFRKKVVTWCVRCDLFPPTLYTLHPSRACLSYIFETCPSNHALLWPLSWSQIKMRAVVSIEIYFIHRGRHPSSILSLMCRLGGIVIGSMMVSVHVLILSDYDAVEGVMLTDKHRWFNFCGCISQSFPSCSLLVIIAAGPLVALQKNL